MKRKRHSAEPTGAPGRGATINFVIREPSRWLLVAAGLGCLVVLRGMSRRERRSVGQTAPAGSRWIT
jgi:hypothetical protein